MSQMLKKGQIPDAKKVLAIVFEVDIKEVNKVVNKDVLSTTTSAVDTRP